MKYKQIPENTFGDTPAAMYLARVLNEKQDPIVLKNCGKRISATNSAANELFDALFEYSLSPKTVANTLRLMRAEIVAESSLADTFADRLRRNVQIGKLKKLIRLTTDIRKVERGMSMTKVVPDVTAKVLHERSERRCARLGKAHMQNHE